MHDMERDDLLLRGIAEGATSSAALAARTGLSLASVWRGLHRLIGSGHVFAPTRGAYRLTALGAQVLAPSAGPDPTSDPADRESAVRVGATAQAPDALASEAGAATIEPPPPGSGASAEGRATVPAWLRWSGLVALGAGVVAVLFAAARPPAPATPAAVPSRSAAWPHSGQSWDW